MRRLSLSSLMMRNVRTWSSSTTSRGCSIRRSESSEMCIKPSISRSPVSLRLANAPNFVSLVIVPSTSWPSSNSEIIFDQGSSSSSRIERLIRLRSGSSDNTLTSTLSPILSNSRGCAIRFQEISDRCTSPSAPPMSMKAPKSARLMTCPVRISPGWSSAISRSLSTSRASRAAARSERINRLRRRSTSITFAAIGSETIIPHRFSGVSP